MVNRYFFLKPSPPSSGRHPILETTETGTVSELTGLLALRRDGGCYESGSPEYSPDGTALRVYAYPTDGGLILLNHKAHYDLTEVREQEARAALGASE